MHAIVCQGMSHSAGKAQQVGKGYYFLPRLRQGKDRLLRRRSGGAAGHQGAAQADGKANCQHQAQSGPPVLDKEIADPSLGLLGRAAHGCRQPGLGQCHAFSFLRAATACKIALP